MSVVSIIIPVYATHEKHLDYLVDCVASCVRQSDNVVLWDDGSPLDVLAALGQYPEVTYVRGAHVGKSYSRNSAASMTLHDLILPVDADDWLAPTAVEAMLEAWDNHGIPVYSDIWKVHPDGSTEYSSALAFDCTEIMRKCIPSVSVLHSKEQWSSIGGWPESYNMYEDWLYNAKLMWNYGGFKVPHPLLYYRQHNWQSTAVATQGTRHDAWVRVKFELEQYSNGEGDIDMPCCGQRRTSGAKTSRTFSTQTAPAPLTQQSVTTVDMSTTVPSLAALGDPGPGKVHALYVGGRGMGPHDKRGMNSRRKYQRVQYGGRYVVAAEDAIAREAFEKGAKNCGFIRLEQTMQEPESRPAGEPPAVPKKPAKKVVRKPVKDAEVDKYVEAMESMSLREFSKWLGAMELTTEQVVALKEAELSGANRIGAIRMLDKRLSEMTTQ